MAAPLDLARQRLESYLQAETRILAAGQEGTVATRRRRDAELTEIRAAIRELQLEITRLEGAAAGGTPFIQVDFR